jgi:hypothetical protein
MVTKAFLIGAQVVAAVICLTSQEIAQDMIYTGLARAF